MYRAITSRIFNEPVVIGGENEGYIAMDHAKSLPDFLADRYRAWKDTKYEEKADHLRTLARDGQTPSTLLIACSDSRIHAFAMFGVEPGEFFLHRNIANLVPAYEADGGVHGTSAVIEYAVTALNVPHIVVLGHSGCGGVRGCHDMCRGDAPALEEKTSFVGRWMDALRPGYERVKHIEDEATRVSTLEREGVIQSLGNLMTFPFVASRVNAGEVSLHGLWTDIGEGTLEQYDPSQGAFVPV